MKTVYRMKVLLVIFTLFLFLVGAGCETKKGSLAKEEKKNKNNPCSLLSNGEVEAVLKQKLAEPKLDGIICVYESVKRSPSAYLKLDLSPVEPDMFMQNRNDFKNKDSFRSVDGVGENAYFFNDQLHILEKKYYLSMSIQGGKHQRRISLDLQKRLL